MPARNLKQIFDECVFLTKSTPSKSINGGILYKWKGLVGSFIIGELKFDGLPNFCLNIFDESHALPCLILNPAKNVKKLLRSYGQVILVNEPELIVEIFIINGHEYVSVHVLIDASNMHVIEKNIRQFSIALKESKLNMPSKKCNLVADEWRRKFVPLKISSSILTSKSEIFCFVLASLVDSVTNCNKRDHLVWFILRNEQTVWKDLLVPNQIYDLVISKDVSLDHFKKYISLLSVIDDNLNSSFHQILHHKDFIKTNAAIFLPEKLKICISDFNPMMPLQDERWHNISDAKLKFLKFTSVFGVVKEINYFDSFKTKNCIWCWSGNTIFEATLKEPSNSQINTDDNSNQEWNNLFFTPLNDEDHDEVCFPVTSFEVPKNEKIKGFGVRGGKLTIQVSLENCFSGEVASVFIKQWQLQQYPAGLVKDVVVCFTDVNVKISKSNRCYFVCTPFTRVTHLKSSYESLQIQLPPIQFMKYAFPCVGRQEQKIWGILELDLPLKVTISAKCKRCNYSFSHYACSNELCPKYRNSVGSDYEIVASARLLVHNFKGSEMSTLYLKNETVQKYLGIPTRIWRYFCDLSANAQFCYLHQREENEPKNQDAISVFFHSYCKYFRPKKRYHVECKQFKDDVSRFFCVNLVEINEERVDFSRYNFSKAMKK